MSFPIIFKWQLIFLNKWHILCDYILKNKKLRRIKMVAIRKYIALFMLFLYGLCTYVAEIHADTHIAVSCSYADVSEAIAAASPEDTVLVPAGSCTWNSTLEISTGINLIGGNGGTTTITRGSGPLINYNPSDYSANYAFRLSGFRFDANGYRILDLGTYSKEAPFTLQTKVRVDNNVFTNSGGDVKGQAIWNYGTLYGVVDNNTFDGINYPIANSYGVGGDSWWSNSPQNIFKHGSAYYLYYEDNLFTNMSGYAGGADNIIMDGEYSSRYVFRYNSVDNDAPSYSLLEMHGQQGEGPASMAASFGAELYGNQITNGSNTMTFWKQRSGQSLVFFNNATTSSGASNTAYTSTVCTCPVNYTSLKVTHNSYWFNSRKNLTGALFGASATGGLNGDGIENIPTLGRDVFSDNSSPGIGCGSALPETCDKNEGYWLTNQSCGDLTGMVGANPATPISGMLYKCTSPNTWTAYYTPYTYPHPLRGEAQAMDYYVDQNHPSASDENTGTIDLPWKTITKANQTLTAGDTVYIKAGTYNSYIDPDNSGTPSAPITYRNYETDTVTISGVSYAIYLNGSDYISIQGINATNCTRFLYLVNGANYNIIKNCSFDDSSVSEWSASQIKGSSQYNWIQNCQFSKGGECSAGGSDNGLVLEIGNEESSSDLSNYNLVEDSTLFHGGHHVLGLHGRYNTIRNNYFHNEAWSRNRGNRTLCSTGYVANTGYNLIENNRFGYAARPCDAPTVGNVAISTMYNIFRYNMLYHHNAYGIGTYGYSGYSNGSYNKFYNNTIFNSGYNIDPEYEGGSEDTAVWFGHSSNTGNVLKNNLYYENYQVYAGYIGNQTFVNEFDGDTEGDPLFVNASTTPPEDKTDSTLPNLDLQSGSPAINAGGALTTVAAADTGSGTSLVVSDAGYFQDGTWAPSGTVDADWIAVGTVGNIVQISSISGNTITLSNSISRQDGDSVWLYKDSDGTIVLYGSAPDAGAYEFLQASAPVRSGGSPTGTLPSGTTSTTLSLSTNENATCRYS
ncbi:MAG: hypothetical protein IMY74_05325, partial [Bacteroidetes bacterium]|nr:hypothetical protein [Bacteroidota bacterium]